MGLICLYDINHKSSASFYWIWIVDLFGYGLLSYIDWNCVYMKVKINVYDVKHIGGQLAFFGSGMLHFIGCNVHNVPCS